MIMDDFDPRKSMNIHDKSMKIHEKSMFSEPWVPVTNLKGNFLLSQDPVLHVLRSAISLCGCRAGLPLSHSAVASELNAILCNV